MFRFFLLLVYEYEFSLVNLFMIIIIIIIIITIIVIIIIVVVIIMFVRWDKKRLENGEDWEDSFCAGLVSSQVFVCLISKEAINSKTKTNNFGLLKEDSPCDNVLLEHRLALELNALGYIDTIYPVMIGEFPADKMVFQEYNFGKDSPVIDPKLIVKSVEATLAHHMEDQSLGSPTTSSFVKDTMVAILKLQAHKIIGEREQAFQECAKKVISILH